MSEPINLPKSYDRIANPIELFARALELGEPDGELAILFWQLEDRIEVGLESTGNLTAEAILIAIASLKDHYDDLVKEENDREG